MLTTIQKALGIRTQIESASPREALLTFDDGPDPVVTGKILDALDKAGAKAVFFVVGNRIHKAEHMLNEVLDRGHIIGNHSYTHWLGKPPGLEQYFDDVGRCQQCIFDICGYTPTLYRPPLGAVNLATITTVRRLNMEIYKWSLDTNDWRLRDDATAKHQATVITDQLTHRDVILMHDDNVHTPAMLNEMLNRMSELNYDLSSFVNNRKMLLASNAA